MNTALLLLEIQNDYFPNGRTPLEKSVEASDNAKKILDIYRSKKWPIVHLQQISTEPHASSLLPCTKGAEFHANVMPLKNETVIKKHYPNSFKDTGLLNYLIKNKINHLVICGMMTHLSIDATVRAAYDLGFNCTVVHDACTTKPLNFHHTHISEREVHYAFIAGLASMYASVFAAEDFVNKMGTNTTVDA